MRLIILLLLSSLLCADDGYDPEFVDLVQFIYGEGYLSQGGSDAQFEGIDLEGKRMLDIGSGLGGRDLDLARKYAVDIVGIDPEAFLVERANALKAEEVLRGSVTFEVTQNPFTLQQFPSNSFDIVASRETLLHLPFAQKPPFAREMYRVLKPGGKLVVVDWVQGRPYSESTYAMMEADGVIFQLHSPQVYKQTLLHAGFQQVEVIDETAEYIAHTAQNIAFLRAHREAFIARFGQENYDYAIVSWQQQKCAFEKGEILVVKLLAVKR